MYCISTAETAVAISVFLSLTFVVLWFQILKTWDNKKAHYRLSHLEHSIQLNKSQIKKRKTYLNRYNFSIYNLDEALIIQLDIKVWD